MTELTHIKIYTSGDNVVLFKKDFESIFKVMDKLEEKNQELEEENKQLRKLLKIGRTNAKDIIDILNEQEQQLKGYIDAFDCSTCKYQNYDWFDDGDEFEVCDKGNNEAQMDNHSCKDWEEL